MTIPSPSLARGTANNLLLSRAEFLAVSELWNSYSGAPGLLDAVPTDATRRIKSYTYDPDKEAYYSPNGRKVTDARLRHYVRNVSNESSLRMKKSTQQLIAGVILLSTWYDAMHSLMSALYQTVWILSIGGYVFENDTARNIFYALMLPQFTYLYNFEGQIKTGEQKLDGSALSRAGLYGKWGNNFYQNISLENAKDKYTDARRVLGPTEDHCHDSAERPGCVELANKGWMPIGEMTPIGDATCYSNCLCHIQYR